MGEFRNEMLNMLCQLCDEMTVGTNSNDNYNNISVSEMVDSMEKMRNEFVNHMEVCSLENKKYFQGGIDTLDSLLFSIKMNSRMN